MLGILFIILCILCGFVICRHLFPELLQAGKTTDHNNRTIWLPDFFVQLPAWYLTGTLFVTWLVYLTAYLFRRAKQPLLYGNLIVGFVLFLLLFFYFFTRFRKGERPADKAALRRFFLRGSYCYLLFAAVATLFVTLLMYRTFFVKDGVMKVGFSVFSDFAPHLGMIRSFSVSNNFPTQYSHFAGEDIRYHFLFQFMVGNLEYLGLRIDAAFNLPSIFSMVSVYLLLFALAVKVTGSRLCAMLTTVLFTFRSSFTLFRYLAEQKQGTVWNALLTNTEFLGYTQNENWGLWNLNVYCNQRHLAFSLAILLLAVLLFLPYVTEMGETIKQKQGFAAKGRELFFSGQGWSFRSLRFAVGMGLLLGAIAFWNGSVLIATLSILFFMAAASEHRLDYLVTALLALALSLLQSQLFIEGSAVSPSFYFGFLAENKTVFGVLRYIAELTGIVLPVAMAGVCLLRGMKRYLLLAFSVPFWLAFLLSLTVDITVNHKWIMMALMLISIYAAYLLTFLLHERDWWKRTVAVLLLVVLTATGVYDFAIVMKRNENYMSYDLEDPVTLWIEENATCEDLFLTPYYSLHKVVLGGAMLYYGWPYYAWSAGYDTNARGRMVRSMYQAEDSETLAALIEEAGIRYIIVDHDCRTSSEYVVREDVIERTYEEVFTEDTGAWATRIFDTEKRK